MFNAANLLLFLFLYTLVVKIGLFYIRRRNRRLYIILSACFLLHLALLGVVQFVLSTHSDPRRTFFGNDGEYYSMHARIIAAILTDKPLSYIGSLEAVNPWVSEYTQQGIIPNAQTYQIGYITYFYGIVYSVFGYYPLLINLYNIALHLVSGILVFRICKDLFSEKAGYTASALFLFNPTLFYYTTIKVAESSYIFLICLIIYLCVGLNKICSLYTPRAVNRALKGAVNLLPLGYLTRLIILMIALLFLYLLKRFLLFPLIISILLYITILAALHFKKIKTLLLVSPIFLLCINQKLLKIFNELFYGLAASHKAYLTSGGQVYELLKFGNDFNSYTFIHKLAYLFSSWMHFVVEPEKYTSLPYLLYHPFKMVFIFLFVLALLGMVVSIRAKKKETIFLMLYLFFAGTIVAGASGNVGTMLRHRDIITFVVFIFAAHYIHTITRRIKRYSGTL